MSRATDHAHLQSLLRRHQRWPRARTTVTDPDVRGAIASAGDPEAPRPLLPPPPPPLYLLPHTPPPTPYPPPSPPRTLPPPSPSTTTPFPYLPTRHLSTTRRRTKSYDASTRSNFTPSPSLTPHTPYLLFTLSVHPHAYPIPRTPTPNALPPPPCPPTPSLPSFTSPRFLPNPRYATSSSSRPPPRRTRGPNAQLRHYPVPGYASVLHVPPPPPRSGHKDIHPRPSPPPDTKLATCKPSVIYPTCAIETALCCFDMSETGRSRRVGRRDAEGTSSRR